jgi:hypothetical protein
MEEEQPGYFTVLTASYCLNIIINIVVTSPHFEHTTDVRVVFYSGVSFPLCNLRLTSAVSEWMNIYDLRCCFSDHS